MGKTHLFAFYSLFWLANLTLLCATCGKRCVFAFFQVEEWPKSCQHENAGSHKFPAFLLKSGQQFCWPRAGSLPATRLSHMQKLSNGSRRKSSDPPDRASNCSIFSRLFSKTLFNLGSVLVSPSSRLGALWPLIFQVGCVRRDFPFFSWHFPRSFPLRLSGVHTSWPLPSRFCSI